VSGFGSLWAGLLATGIAFPASTTVSISQPAVSGTGANAGQAFSVSAQPGQQQSGSNANNAGGPLNLSSGAAGTGGSGAAGVAGAVNLQVGGVTQFSINGAASVITVTPSTIQWSAGTVAPTLTQATALSDVPTATLRIQSQAPFALATVNTNPGSIQLNVPTSIGATVLPGVSIMSGGAEYFRFAGPYGTNQLQTLGIPCLGVVSGFSSLYAPLWIIHSGNVMYIDATSITFRTPANVQYAFLSSTSFSTCPLQGAASGTPFSFVNSAVTLTSNAATLSAAQQQTPNLTIAAVTLTGAGLLDFGNVIGNFQVNIVGINAASFATFGLSFKNGTTTTALPSTALTNGGLVLVRCDTNALAFCA
jgi:hypothetical protein